MIDTLRTLLRQAVGAAPAGADDRRLAESDLPLATAALLVEMARADHEQDASEQEAMLAGVAGHFGLPMDEARQLLREAEHESEHAVSLHDYTSLLNDCLDPEQKRSVLELLWRVAHADGRIDKYEEYLVRKVADLLYVPHGAYIQAKLAVIGDA